MKNVQKSRKVIRRKYKRLAKKVLHQRSERTMAKILHSMSFGYSSRVAYQNVTSSGFLALPSERTLRDYIHWCSVHNGVQFEYIEQVKKVKSQEGVSENERQFTLLFDEG